jgi:DNA polymerase-3 subunit beta
VVKFRCERDQLLDAATTAGRAASGRGTLVAATNGVRLQVRGDQLSMTGTDRDLTLHVEIEVVGLDDGVCVAPARLLTDIVRSLEPGAVTVEASDEDVVISAGRSRFSVVSYDPEDYPVLPDVGEPQLVLPVDGLVESLRQVVRAASTDDARPLLTGVLLSPEEGGLRLVATDSYRLAWRDLPGRVALSGEFGQILVPARALSELQRLVAGGRFGGDGREPAVGGEVADRAEDGPGAGTAKVASGRGVGFSVGELQATFWVDQVRLTTRLLDGRFPDYRQLVPPSYAVSVQVAKERLLDALRRVRLLVRDNTTPVRLTLHRDGIELTVVSQQVGEANESVDAVVSGEEVTVAFNPSYLIDGVDAVAGDDVVIEVLDSSKPATVRSPSADDYRYLLMPVRVA